VTAVDEMVLSQQDQPQILRSTHQITRSGVVRIIFSPRFWLEVFKATPAKELKQTAMRDSSAQNSYLHLVRW